MNYKQGCSSIRAEVQTHLSCAGTNPRQSSLSSNKGVCPSQDRVYVNKQISAQSIFLILLFIVTVNYGITSDQSLQFEKKAHKRKSYWSQLRTKTVLIETGGRDRGNRKYVQAKATPAALLSGHHSPELANVNMNDKSRFYRKWSFLNFQ